MEVYDGLIEQVEPDKKEQEELYKHLLDQRGEMLCRLKYLNSQIKNMDYTAFLDEVRDGKAPKLLQRLKQSYKLLEQSFNQTKQLYKNSAFARPFEIPNDFRSELNAVMRLEA